MANILIMYDSFTGNTKKMAEYVFEGVKKYPVNVRLKHVDETTADDVIWCDGIAVGSPTNIGLASWKIKRFFDVELLNHWGKIDGKIGCAFSSSGGWGGGNEIACMSILTMLMNYGFLVFGVTDYVGDRFTLHYGAVVAGEPRTKEEKEACIRLGERLAQWTLAYVDGKKEYLEFLKRKKEED